MKNEGYVYSVRMPATAVTAAKTLMQIKTGAAAIEILDFRLAQTTKTTSELLALQILRKTATATVTSATPVKINSNDPASLAVGGTSATGYNASAEGTDGDILWDGVWNVLNGEYPYLPTPEARIWTPQTDFIAIKLLTAPAASMTLTLSVFYVEYR